MKRSVFFGSLVLAFLSLSILPARTLAATYYVSQTTGGDTLGDGSQAHPYRTLVKAVQVINDTNDTDAVVRVAAGQYDASDCVFMPGPVVSLTGGYDPVTWSYDPIVNRTTVNGGIYLTWGGSTTTVDGFVINGGGIYIDGGLGGTLAISNNIIKDGDGVMAWLYPYSLDKYSNLTLSHNLIVGNTGGVGAIGLYNYGCDTFYHCNPYPPYQLCCTNCQMTTSTITSTNDTIVGGQFGINNSLSYWAPVNCPTSNFTTVRNSIIVNSWSDLVLDGDASINYSDIGDGWGSGVGNISADPMFWDPAQIDHGLQPGSPAINAGDPAAQYNDQDGSRNDMGFTGGNSIWFDTDYDGIPDDWELYYGLDPNYAPDAEWDCDNDGVINQVEYFQGTDPGNCLTLDTDGDGLPDVQELTLGTDPNNPDTDGDMLPDAYEVGHMNGATPLDPLIAADGAEDFDDDGNSNVNEYWNGTDPWVKDPVPDPYYPGSPGCYYWGDGDGDGYVLANDRSILLSEVLGSPQSYDNVLPKGLSDDQDMDADGYILAGDLSILKSFIVNGLVGSISSRAASLENVYEPASPVAVGGTAHVTVRVRNENSENNLYQAGFSVVFSIDPSSTGSAVLLGGDGADGPGTRFSVSGPSGASDGGHATMHLKVTSPGTIIVNATIPACGTSGVGRWMDQVTLDPAFTITTQ